MARSPRLVILIKNIDTLWGRKRFLLPVTLYGVGNASFYLLHTYDESSIPFYSTSNGYIYVLNIASVFRRVKDYSSIYILDQDH